MRLFALTVFSGAFLLFQVQPLVGKFILPWFGGSPGVWTTCMLFFQSLLLVGYLYAHLIARFLSPRRQAIIHLVLLALALGFLPIVPSADWKPSPGSEPTGRILALLTVCLGLPYAVLSATGPLLQEWFARLNPGRSPYRLYALSNAGSLLALVSYPLVFEPAFARLTQVAVWSWCFGLFTLACALCAMRLWKRNPTSSCTANMPVAAQQNANIEVLQGNSNPGTGKSSEASRVIRERVEPARLPASAQRLLWLSLPACASVLLISTTNKLCQDVAVVPFLWVLPLAIYLLSFIICFDNPVWYLRRLFHLAIFPTMILMCLGLFEGKDFPLLLQIGIYSAALFVFCMVCHGELYRLRPPPRLLTSYFLSIAGGGALGGAFVAVLAPIIFNSHLELHAGLGMFSLLILIVYVCERHTVTIEGRCFATWKWALAAFLALGIGLAAQVVHSGRNTILISRNFYGVLRVSEYNPDSKARHTYMLTSGEITHGIQMTDPVLARRPTTYFHEKSGVGLALLNFPRQRDRRIGVVGLGVGTLAAYGQEGDTLRFYEINPEVNRIARSHFTYLADSKARVEVVLGDARLSLEKEAPQQFDILVLDAFSGDAIPVHLLTREAGEIYLRHLKPEGVIAVHITNRHLNLAPVVRNLAESFHLQSSLVSVRNLRDPPFRMPSDWFLLSRNKDFLDSDAIRLVRTEPPRGGARVPLWTDDYASLLKIIY